MKSHAQAVVIGGGITGCSILYHLTKLGWSDVMLLERSELTAGSTWHAAAGNHVLHALTTMSKIHHYTITQFPKIEAETGQSCGIHPVGGIYLASTPERLDQLKIQHAKARYLGIDFETISLDEVSRLNPLIDTSEVLGAWFEPTECHVDPAGVCNAYAKGAQAGGAEVHRFTPVLETIPLPDGRWRVVTPNGDIEADVVVNAAGLWGREVAALAGVSLPLMPMEHQYFVTEDIPELVALDHEIPLLHDNDREHYMRQEGSGLLVGAYEADGRHWAVDGTPLDFGLELLPDDLERIEDNMAAAMARVPALASAGIKRVVNGPMIWSPDVLPLVGPMPGLNNYYMAAGVMNGFSTAGGIGWQLAEWIVEGEPSLDITAIDVARFGADYSTQDYCLARTYENYSTRFSIHFPYEERPAGRPAKIRPLYERHKALGAVFGASYGWEVPLWFAPEGVTAEDQPSFRRTNWFDHVGNECRALRKKVGLLDTSHYAKHEISGPGAEAWLDRLLANRMPVDAGRTVLSPMLNDSGHLVGDFTVTRLDNERFLMVGSGVVERYHRRWFDRTLPADGVTVESRSDALCGFSISGPLARDLLAALTGEDVSNDAFPFLRSREMSIGPAKARVMRISFTGELGYEMYVPTEHQVAVFDAIRAAGEPLDLALIGGRALGSLRIEKGYGSWGPEYGPEYTPFESGLDRFVRFQKDDFVGRDAALRMSNELPAYRLSYFVIDADEADATGGEPVACDGVIVGQVSSAMFGHTVGESLALAYINSDAAKPGDNFTIEILGDKRPARLLAEPLVDPKGERMRG